MIMKYLKLFENFSEEGKPPPSPVPPPPPPVPPGD